MRVRCVLADATLPGRVLVLAALLLNAPFF
jgi:hypothetical protein